MSTEKLIRNMAEVVNDEDLFAVHPFLFLLDADDATLNTLEQDLLIMLDAVRNVIKDRKVYDTVPKYCEMDYMSQEQEGEEQNFYSRSDNGLIDSLIGTLKEIEEGEWAYSKNENRLCRILDDPDARQQIINIREALRRLVG